MDVTHVTGGANKVGKPLRRNGRYSTRRRIPTDLIAAYGGRKELVIALDTADPAQARVLHARMWVTLDEQFAAKRAELFVRVDASVEAAEAARRGAALMRSEERRVGKECCR